MQTIWRDVAEKDGSFAGACVPEARLLKRWLREMKDGGATVGTVSSHEEWDTWFARLQPLSPEPKPSIQLALFQV